MGISKNLQLRLFSALLLIPCLIATINYGGAVFHAVLLLVYAGMIYEIVKMTQKSERNVRIMINIIGIVYISLACYGLYSITETPLYGKNYLLWLLFIVWSSDSFAYIVGKIFKGPKACPSISPNKTWSGMVGGVAGAMLVGYVSVHYLLPHAKASILYYIAVSSVLSVACHLGDLLESGLKRKCGVKESGHIIPGHGGLLDRLDGLLLVAIVANLSPIIQFSS